jgi:DNA-binding NarL/FixJ family response regulator
MAKRIHVFVADDSPALRRAVRTLLEAVPNIRVVGEAGDYAELLAKVDQAHADIA